MKGFGYIENINFFGGFYRAFKFIGERFGITGKYASNVQICIKCNKI